MAQPWMYGGDDEYQNFANAMRQQRGGITRRFDEYYRCYPVAMLPGPDREHANHGGKVFLPPSALEKLTRLHITYPMLFELINGAKSTKTHAGVWEFIAEEGKIYLPYWIMQTLSLEAGDLLQIKSTDLPPGTFIKLQAQSPAFLDISDPKAVLENAFRNFSCLSTGDIFTFAYNDNVYEVAVLEIKPDNGKNAICTMETDLSVDFAEPLGYVPPPKVLPSSAKRGGLPTGGVLHAQGTMAQAINYSSIAPPTASATSNNNIESVHFTNDGHRLGRRTNKNPESSTVAGGPPSLVPIPAARRGTGPQPLRLPKGKLFFGYEVKPLRKNAEKKEGSQQPKFSGMGQTLRGKKVDSSVEAGANAKQEERSKSALENAGRTLRDSK